MSNQHRTEVLGRFEIREALGRGGNGEVFRAYDPKLQREVALKVLHECGEEQNVRLLREGRAAASIAHPNVVQIFDVGQVDGRSYLTMELLRGRTLRHFIGSDVPVATKLTWIVQIALALEAAHSRGIIHRDIKPDNIFVTDDNRIKVLDFGIARAFDVNIDRKASTRTFDPSRIEARSDLAGRTAPGAIKGTPDYMAPEQLRGERLTAATDQFSWAVVAFELLEGRRPWGASDAIKQVAEILSAPPPQLRKLGGRLGAQCSRALRRALSKAPRDRHPDMASAARALDRMRVPSRARFESLGRHALEWWIATAVMIAAAVALTPRRATHKAARPKDQGAALSSNSQALVYYRAGLQAQHDASNRPAHANYARATELDPSFAQAHLRYALISNPTSRQAAVLEHLQSAMRLRASLDGHDLRLLEAFDMANRMPRELPQTARALRDTVARGEPDAETLMLVARLSFFAGDFRESLRACEVAHSLEPSWAEVLWFRGAALLALSEWAGAREAYAECLRLSPTAATCLLDLVEIDAIEGRCADALDTSRRLLSVDPDNDRASIVIANTIVGSGGTLEAARAVLNRSTSRFESAEPEVLSLEDEASFQIFQGRLSDASATLARVEPTMKDEPWEGPHLEIMLLRARLALEEGRLSEAARVAEEFVRRRPAWRTNDRDETSIPADAILYRSNVISRTEYRKRRDGWLVSQGLPAPAIGTGGAPGTRWIVAFADAVEDAEDAREALDHLPAYLPLVSGYTEAADQDESIGRVYLLAGQLSEARRYLARAAHACTPLFIPLHTFQAKAEYILTLALLGERDAACTKYAALASQMTDSPELSRSFRAARDAARPLGCIVAPQSH